MKKYIFGAAVAIVLSACSDDYLNIKDPNNMSDLTFWQTEENMEKALQACYGTLLFQGIYQQWYDLVFEMRGDLCYNESAWRDYANFSKFQAPSSNWECIQYCWNHYYQGINATNQYLAHIDDESIEMDPENRRHWKGEVSWLRAHYYFNMYHLYGGRIPILTEPSAGVIFPEEGTEQEVWDLIEKDLMVAAEAGLPEKYDNENVARITSGAVYAQLGKMWMQRHEWAKAEEAFSHVIGKYKLTDNYFDNFDLEHEFNSESIFEINFTGDTKGDWTTYGTANSPSTCQRARYFAPRLVGGHSDAMPNGAYLAEFDKDEFGAKTIDDKTDPRKSASIVWTRSQKLYGQSFASLSGSTANFMKPNIWSRKYSNGVREGVTTEDDYSAINFRIIRYADILLLMAEALNEQGKTSEAYDFIDQVRTRKSVNLKPLSEIKPGMTQQQMREQLEHERICELGGESVRWFDIMRWGYLDDEAGKQHLLERDYEFETFRPGIDKFLPIPQREIDLNPNFNANTGW